MKVRAPENNIIKQKELESCYTCEYPDGSDYCHYNCLAIDDCADCNKSDDDDNCTLDKPSDHFLVTSGDRICQFWKKRRQR